MSRQRSVLQLLAREAGLTSKQLAERLGLEVPQVQTALAQLSKERKVQSEGFGAMGNIKMYSLTALGYTTLEYAPWSGTRVPDKGQSLEPAAVVQRVPRSVFDLGETP